MGALNVNFCKSPKCDNFGVPAALTRSYKARGTTPPVGHYKLRAFSAGNPGLLCGRCGEVAPLRSNQAIVDELERLTGSAQADELACATAGCAHEGVPISLAKGAYVAFGKTAAGTPRYRCRSCGKTFSGGGRATKRQRKSEKNRDVFVMLVNKMPLSRMAETTGLSIQTIYDKLAFIHRQARAFAHERELRLMHPDFKLGKRYISVDRQHYIVNWSGRHDRRTVQLNSIGSADIDTGYVFGFHLNFDGELDVKAVEADAHAAGDHLVSEPYRKWARVWLGIDYDKALANAAEREGAVKTATVAAKGLRDPLLAQIAVAYADTEARLDVEATDLKDNEVKLPARGMQVHETYTMYAHFQWLSRLTANAERVRIYMDQDSGFRAAFMAAFHERIRARTADGFFVSVEKNATTGEKRMAVEEAQERLAHVMSSRGLTREQAALELMLTEMDHAIPMGRWGDKWVFHPLPMAAEPAKRVCWLTDLGDYSEEHAARLLLRATLHPIDRFFMQTRRRINMAERPVVSVRRKRNMWHGYGAYSPGNLAMFLEIYRTYYNYCLAGQDKQTPAQRLGLPNAPLDPHDIIYFRPR